MHWRFVLALLLSIPAYNAALANDGVAARSRDPSQWALQTGDYADQRYSRLDQINTANVASMKVAWSFSTGVLRGHEGSPLVIGGIMYLHTPFPNVVYALDLDDENRVLWAYKPKQDGTVTGVMCCDTVNHGLAYAEGKIFLYQADTTLVALDARSGKEVWHAVNGDPKKGETGVAAPFVVKDKVLVGISGADLGVRGFVTAYNINGGARIWRAYSVGPDAEILFDPDRTTSLGKPVGRDSSLKTWTGDQWTIGGGAVWGWFSYDPALDLVYYGTANPSTWNPDQRAGPDGKPIDQKWTMSIIARHPDTGLAAWAYQMTPFDEWDYDGINEMILADLDIGGSLRKALVHFDRNGFAYTLDRVSGELISAKPYDPDLNWSTGVEMDPSKSNYGRPSVVAAKSTFQNGPDNTTTGICPSSIGAKNEQPASFSPLTGLFYVPMNSLCMNYEPYKVNYTPGQPFAGATLSIYPQQGRESTGRVIAWDAREGKTVFSEDERFSVWSGVLATAGGIFCYGTLEGYLKCRDQKNGTELFRHRTPSGIIGNVFTYALHGKQYIGVFSGVGGWAGIGLAAGLDKPEDGAGAVGAYAGLKQYTALGGTLSVYTLP
jgi:PQQ-dependent dehydrogenase (methanol/ethanol family)